MIIDCNECAMQHTSTCDDCIVPMLVDLSVGTADLSDAESDAVRHLSEAGLVSPIRLVPLPDPVRDRSAG